MKKGTIIGLSVGGGLLALCCGGATVVGIAASAEPESTGTISPVVETTQTPSAQSWSAVR